jgi:subtilisin family serine protease
MAARPGRLRTVAAIAAGLLFATAAPAAHGAPGPANAPEYWFDNWHVNDLWHSGVRGQGITIAEIDTGVNAGLPELAGRVVPGRDFGAGGDGRVDRDVKDFGHGTAMASIMVGRPGLLGITGLAPDAKVLPVALPLTGTTDAAPDDHLAEAIRWAVDHGGKVISMSLGGARDPSTDKVPCPVAEQSAIYYALSHGAVLLAAAGNNGLSTNAVEEPGVCLGVVAVGAVDQAGTAAAFSSRHRYVTLGAPGVAVASLSRTRGSAFAGDGTSQATAIASAAFALVRSKYPRLSGSEVVARVLATLDQHHPRRDPGVGYGVLDAYRAVTEAVPASAPDPVAAAAEPFRAREQAFRAAAVAPPAPAAAPRQSLGRFSIGNAPRLFVPQVLTGIAIAAAGLIALIALAVSAGLRRRRRPDPMLAAAEAVAARRDAMPPLADGDALIWRDVSAPPKPKPGPSPH